MGLIERRERPFVWEGDDAEERREEPDIFEQLESIRRGEPARPSDDLFSQALRAIRDREITEVPSGSAGRGFWDSVRAGVFTGPAPGQRDSIPGFTDDRGVFVSTQHPDYEGQLMRWLLQLRMDGIITETQSRELDSASYRTRLPTRAELARQRLDTLLKDGVLTQRLHGDMVRECANPGFRIHPNPLYYEKILRCCYMLEGIRDFMDNWIEKGMIGGEPLDDYLVSVGKKDFAVAHGELPPPGGLTDEEWLAYRQVVESNSYGLGRKVSDAELREFWRATEKRVELKKTPAPSPSVTVSREEYLERGRRIVSAVWAVFRPDIERAIEIARHPEWVSLRQMGPAGMNVPGIPGYTLDAQTVANSDARTIIGLMVHEPMHDWSRYRLWHKAMGGWRRVEEEIGWEVGPDRWVLLGGILELESRGDWELGLAKFVEYLFWIMSLSPGDAQPGQSAVPSQWKSSLLRSGIEGH